MFLVEKHYIPQGLDKFIFRTEGEIFAQLNCPLLTLLCCPPPSRIYTQMSSWNFSKMLLNPGDDC